MSRAPWTTSSRIEHLRRRPWPPLAVTRRFAAGGLAVAVSVALRRRRDRRLTTCTSGEGPAVTAHDGVMLHVETDGPDEAHLTVVFAHGFCSDLTEYDEQRRDLREDYRLVLFDQRGHGRSGWGGRGSATIAQLGDDLGRVIDACAAGGQVAVVGHSMGGMALMALARSRPELFGTQVVAVALMSTSAGRLTWRLPAPLRDVLVRSRALRASLWLVWWGAPLIDLLGPFRTRVGRRLLRRRLFGLDPPPEAMLTQVQRMWAATPFTTVFALHPEMLLRDTTPALSTIATVSSLVLAGEADSVIPIAHSKHIASSIGDEARLVLVPRAGHMLTMTHAATVNDALRSLCRQALDRERRQPGRVQGPPGGGGG